jgi:hypothetical protein
MLMDSLCRHVALLRLYMQLPREMVTALPQHIFLHRPISLCCYVHITLRNFDACLMLGILNREVLQVP